jgi:hypothetical protein
MLEVNELDDQQSLIVLDCLSSEVAQPSMPQGPQEQAAALKALFGEFGINADVLGVTGASNARSAPAAREVLDLFARSGRVDDLIAESLADPPTQEAAALPLLLAAPVVLTGCVALLQLVGHVSFKRDTDGAWSFGYDPSQRTPFDATLKEMVGILAKIVGSLAKGSP